MRILFIIGIIGLLIFSWPAFFQIYGNWQRDQYAPVTVAFSALKINDEEYLVEADYSFDYEEKKYNGIEILQGVKYKNPFYAVEALPSLSKEYKRVWFDKKNPENSSLENHFPLKRVLYSLTLLALLIYFWALFKKFSL